MLDQSGNFLWASLLEGNNNFGCGSSIAIDGSNNIYTTGFYSSTVDFNPMAPVINISAAGQTDIFVHKMNYLGTPLPIELVSFNGENLGNTNILKWSTRSEVNNDYFSLLKSSDGINFEKIGIVSGAGNSSQVLNYSFIDNTPFDAITYYRLQQTDYDGQSSFSPIIALKQIFAEVNPISISPIPSSDFIHLEFSGQEFDFSLELYDVTGLCIYKSRNERVINLTTISSGAYFLKIFNEENSWTKKIIKN
ncbi:MAG: T9SS type A sorting domain-containing protein [Flammeovirgaceae bacterium]|nr:T9SS type A sorting domain-containing protein [Flammeovirgaceae bacterium]